MTSALSCRRHLQACYRTGAKPSVAAADAKTWYLAVCGLLERGALPDATFAATELAAAFPESQFLARAAMLLDRMPGPSPDPAFAAFVPTRFDQVQLCAHAGAATLLLVFGGRHGGLGMPLAIAHRWFGALGVHVAYLRDPDALGYVGGIPALAADRAGTVAALRRMADDVGASRITCCGNSVGGYAAMLYGLELDAHTVLAMNAFDVATGGGNLARFGDRFVEARLGPDLPKLYDRGGTPPRLLMTFDADSAGEDDLPNRMAFVPGARLIPVAGTDGHDAHVTLMRRGELAPLFDELR